MPDIAAFGGILADSRLGKREVAVIADKGFESDANEEAPPMRPWATSWR